MTVNLPPSERLTSWRLVGFAGFAAVVALFLLVSSKAGIRGVGALLLVGAAVQLATRRIPYGWEGREPSGHITGFPAVLLSLLMGAAGIAMLVRPDLMLMLFGWGDV